jgi:hypothetical protein
MMRAAFAALASLASLFVALPGCQDEHRVKLELGGGGSISQGFLCRTDTALPGLSAGDFLFERGHDLITGDVRFSLVVEVTSLGDVLPGCLPEEILGVCRADGACPRAARFCAPLSVAGPRGKRLAMMTEPEAMAFVAQLGAALEALPPIFRDAPDGPVVVRAVASTDSCDQLAEVDRFEVDGLMGCAYSCPVVLDELDGALRLGFATSEAFCAPEVRGCAAYPGAASPR